jgi:hypothetical protein
VQRAVRASPKAVRGLRKTFYRPRFIVTGVRKGVLVPRFTVSPLAGGVCAAQRMLTPPLVQLNLPRRTSVATRCLIRSLRTPPPTGLNPVERSDLCCAEIGGVVSDMNRPRSDAQREIRLMRFR